MSAQPDADTKPDVASPAKILGVDWHVVFGFLGILGTIVAFLYSILNTSELNRFEIGQLSKDVTGIHSEYKDITTHLDVIEHSIGRIEGQINRYGSK